MASARHTRLALVGLASTAALGLGGLTLGSSPAAAAGSISVSGDCEFTVTVTGMLPGQQGALSLNVGEEYERTPIEANGEGTWTRTFPEGTLPDGAATARYYSNSGENGYESDSTKFTVQCDDATPTSSTSTSESPTSTDTESPTSTDTESPTSTDTESPTSTDTESPTSTDTESPTSTDTESPTSTDDPTDPGDPTGTDTNTPPPSSSEETTSGPNVDTGVVGGDDSSNGVLALAGLATVGGVAAAGAFARRRLNDDEG